MYVYTSTNPCLCTSNTNTPTPGCPTDCTCLQVCNVTVNGLDPTAVGPCAQTGTLDLTDPSINHDFCACGENPPIWSIVDYDSTIFTTAEITTGGDLTWITGGGETAGKYGVINVKVCCGILSTYACVIIGIADQCNCPTCGTCEDCDPCTGLCLEGQIQVGLTGINTSADPLLNSN
jgi:hypothetical protein